MKICTVLLIVTILSGCNASNLETTNQERVLFAQISNAPERTLLHIAHDKVWLLKHCAQSNCIVLKAPFETPSFIVTAELDSLGIIEIIHPNNKQQFNELSAQFTQQR